jgi:integrase
MSAKRTGTLVPKPSGFFARVWVKLADGTEERRWMNLQTKDRTTARRKLTRLVSMLAAGELVAEAQAKALEQETYKAFTLDRHNKRKASGVVMADTEQSYRRDYIYPVIGDLYLRKVTDDHVRQVLEDARDKDLAWESVRKIRAVMSRDFKRARIEKLIERSPVQDVGLPDGLKKDKRPFVSLTDQEIAQYLAAPEAKDLETKMASITARTQGGARTAELIRWDWSFIDQSSFERCSIRRAKTGEVQTGVEIPEVLRSFLRAWWERAGKPSAGPVFPVRRGKRVGLQKSERGTSFAGRLRRDLFRAGVVRLPPVVDPKTKKPAPNPADPIYFDTPVSRHVDFHSFRRAYDRALARVGVNMQTAMTLSSHSDPKQHMGYVREVDVMQTVPVAALPAIDGGLALRLLRPSFGTQSPTDDNSSRRMADPSSDPTLTVRQGDSENALPCASLQTKDIASGAVGRRFESCRARRAPVTAGGSRCGPAPGGRILC